MRIGIAVPALGFRGGLERYAFEVGKSFVERGHEVTLVHGPERGRDVEAFCAPFAVVGAVGAPDLTRGLDVLFVQRAKSLDDLAAHGDVPIVVAAHDHDLTCARSHRYLPYSNEPCHRAPGLGCVARGCALVRSRVGFPLGLVDPRRLARETRALTGRAPIVACSDYVARCLREAGVAAERVHAVHPVLPGGSRPVRPRPSARVLLVSGQLLHGKGFDVAIEALAYLPPDVVLHVAGEGPSRPELHALAAAKAPGRVHFLGYVEPERIDDVYDSASVVLVPSRWPEPFGMVGLEAMRRGRPVVGAAHGGIPEWLVPGAGALVPPLDPRALATAALELLSDPDAGQQALTAAGGFSHEDTVRDLLEILGGAAAERRRLGAGRGAQRLHSTEA